MKLPFIIAVCASLVLSVAAQAGETKINSRFSGNSHPTMIDTNGDGIFAAAGTFQSRGAPGRSVAHSIAEFTALAPYGTPGCDLRGELVYESWVETYNDGSMIFYTATGGYSCLDLTTLEAHAKIMGTITGGTGRFEGATGSVVVNVPTFIVVGGGMNAFAGTTKGTIEVSSSADDDSDSD